MLLSGSGILAEATNTQIKILPRLVKMASNFLSEPIANIISTAIDTNTFPDRAKQAFVTPVDKGGNDKHITLIIDQLVY